MVVFNSATIGSTGQHSIALHTRAHNVFTSFSTHASLGTVGSGKTVAYSVIHEEIIL